MRSFFWQLLVYFLKLLYPVWRLWVFLGVLICTGVEVIGNFSGRFFILRLHSWPSCCGVLLKKSISLSLDSIKVWREFLFILLLESMKNFSISIELLEYICWSISHLVLLEKCDKLKSSRSRFPDLFKLESCKQVFYVSKKVNFSSTLLCDSPLQQ